MNRIERDGYVYMEWDDDSPLEDFSMVSGQDMMTLTLKDGTVCTVPVSALMIRENWQRYWDSEGIGLPGDRQRLQALRDDLQQVSDRALTSGLGTGWMRDVVSSVDSAISLIDFVVTPDPISMMEEVAMLMPVPKQLVGTLMGKKA